MSGIGLLWLKCRNPGADWLGPEVSKIFSPADRARKEAKPREPSCLKACFHEALRRLSLHGRNLIVGNVLCNALNVAHFFN